jgi:uncharacterized RDD family membrane protein YckC
VSGQPGSVGAEDPANPYRAPLSDVARVTPPDARIAGRWRRWFTLLIDGLVLDAIELVIGWVLPGSVPGLGARHSVLGLLGGSLIYLAYYTVFEATTSRTPGKMLCGTRVVREDGGRPPAAQILGRSAARLIPLEAFWIFRASRSTLHDSLSGTQVIRSSFLAEDDPTRENGLDVVSPTGSDADSSRGFP